MAERGKKTRHDGIYKLKDGRWLLQVVLRVDGRRKAVQKMLPASVLERDAVAARARMFQEAQASRDEAPAPAPPDLTTQPIQALPVAAAPVPPSQPSARPTGTVADYVTRWLKRKKAELRPATVEDYTEVLSSRILPVIGEVSVADLRRSHVLDWRTWAEEQRIDNETPYAGGTLALWWRVLRVVLNDLIADYDLHPGLTFRIKPPKSSKARVRCNEALTTEQLKALLDAVKKRYPKWYAEIYICAFGGMRPSELYALHWGDIDLAGGKLTICRSVVNGHVNRPKNNRSRIVALTDEMVRLLREHRATQPGLPGARVFSSDVGTVRDDTTLYHTLVECGKDAKIPFMVGPQVLRYTANTLLREAGVADEIVRDRLGHTTREMGHRYFKGHIDAQREAVEGLRRQVEGR